MGRQHSLHLAMQQQHVEARVGIGCERWPFARDIRYRQDGEVQLRKEESLRIGVRDVDSKLSKQAQDAAGLGGPRRVVIPGNDDDWHLTEGRSEPAELQKCVDDRRVRGTNVVKNVAAKNDEIGSQ